MFPSLVNNGISSPSWILQVIHGAVGVPAVTLSAIYVFNDLPLRTRKWMRATAILWVMSIALGVLVCLTITSFGNSVNVTGSTLAYKDVYLGNSPGSNTSAQSLESTLASSPYAVAGLGISFLTASPIAWKLIHRNMKTKKNLKRL
jgi:hypothetical protein